MLSFKNGKKYLGYYFSEIIREYLKKLNINFDYIIPMPIHENRLKERSFNQSEILVSNLKDENLIEYNVLKRIKDTPHQTGLNKSNRKTNLEDAFTVVDKDKVKDKIILLVDDIYTSGSSIYGSYLALKNYTKDIKAITIAYVVK